MRAVTSSIAPTAAALRPRQLLAADAPAPSDPARILSRADSEALFKRVAALASGGDTTVLIRSTWTANLRWGRNRPTSSGNTVEQSAVITRTLPGVSLSTELNQLDDATLKQAMQQLEQRLASQRANPNDPIELLGRQEYLTPAIWSDETYNMSLRDLSEATRKSVDPVVDAKMVAAGYVELGATSWAIFNTRGLNAYAAATGALYTETVRMPDGSGSGWAGKSHTDWAKLDVSTLSKTALKKCRDSANPVKIEPGRYTAILEPKAVALLMWSAVETMDRGRAEAGGTVYSIEGQRKSKIGLPVFDSRLTITSDPTDPECGYIPFDPEGNPYRKVTWVEHGILKELPYNRGYARHILHTDMALPNPMAFSVTGGETSIEEMIATTDRGIYVTHFGRLELDDPKTWSSASVTRDGLWLIEHGKIVHPIKNLWIYDSPMVIFNQVLQLGPPVRTVGVQEWGWFGVNRDLPSQALNDGNAPVVAPPMKVRDFNFTRLIDAI